MLLRRTQLLLLAVSAVSAFRNTSPFLFLSSDLLDSDTTLQATTLVQNDALEDQIIDTLQTCDRKWYYIFTQQHVGANDLRSESMPKMAASVNKADEQSVVEVSGVVGALDGERVKERLTEACDRMGRKAVESWPEGEDEYRIITMALPELPAEAKSRRKAIKDTDDALAPTVETVLSAQQQAVLMYITTPPSPKVQDHVNQHHYEMDDPYPSSMHTDLKRDVYPRQDSEGGNMQAGLPLFEKYQFLTPGLFMGLFVTIILLSILYIGVSAISGLEVSYMAFSKEMGPQAQKNKQQ